jgi:2,3-bisphosphoglycerate-independent phosphoglycerate mutase
MIVTADHGNIEQLRDPVTGQPHTAHTTNLVPLVVMSDRPFQVRAEGGSLPDVMPTILHMMWIEQMSVGGAVSAALHLALCWALGSVYSH